MSELFSGRPVMGRPRGATQQKARKKVADNVEHPTEEEGGGFTNCKRIGLG
jgi:U3 small nucleolar RNA-associated protein 14